VVVRKDKSVISEEELIATLKQDIAGFKVPKEVIFVDELPRNAMGKVQKNVLRNINIDS
jgi:malonyl-CoA/methylmalonyl-CoA synthetase